MEHGKSACPLWSPQWRKSYQNIKYSSFLMGLCLLYVCSSLYTSFPKSCVDLCYYQFVHCQIETGAIFILSNGFGPSEVCLLKLEAVFVPCKLAYKFVRRAFDLIKEKSGVWTWIWCTGLCFSRFYSFLFFPEKRGSYISFKI